MVAHGGSTSCIEFYNQKIHDHCSFLSAGPIPLDLSIPKMDDIERQISRDLTAGSAMVEYGGRQSVKRRSR